MNIAAIGMILICMGEFLCGYLVAFGIKEKRLELWIPGGICGIAILALAAVYVFGRHIDI